ncbi:SGNH/GDSL hydrolase family protein [Vallicoccus soli]|uniref:SGNH/GDSL hydrolase family protein n=1 Tax=Vallicoccus soli TaxID=2339232 RepID=A0A3A3Z5Y2_9ACTN|nr:SGNH/GDSL hydrolase family protein [Vallicoccus soli]
MGDVVRVRHVRRVAVAAAYGGGGLGAFSAGAVAVLAAQVRLARRAIPRATERPPVPDGRYDPPPGPTADPLRLTVVGDSSAAGFGVQRASETTGALVAAGLAEAAGRSVELVVHARIGARSSDLERQVGLALAGPVPDVVLVMVGANDVTHRMRPATSVRLLAEAVARLRAAGTEVVVGTCPDLGTIEPIGQPLRLVARQWSRNLAAAQTMVVVEAGGRSVSLGDLLGPEFAARPREMFAPDRFHPSAAGYRAAAGALLPTVCAAVGVGTDAAPDARRGEGVRSVAEAAVEAAGRAGTEVTAADVAGRDRGPWGRWTLLRRRSRQDPPPTPRPAEPAEPGGPAEPAEPAVERP